MDRPPHKLVVCPILVGRALHLSLLHQFIADSFNGQGQTVLVSGEAGVGKSRLLAEAKAEAQQKGFLILQGNCFQPDTSYPYAPLLDMLRQHIDGSQSSMLPPDAEMIVRELCRLLPDLAPLVPLPEIGQSLDPDQHKRRLYAVMLQFFAYYTAQQPILLVIEDIHWSDDTCLEFLYQLARWSQSHRLLLAITYRSDDIRPLLRHWLAELERAHLATELALTRLDRFEVEAMVKAIFDLDRPLQAEFLDTIYPLTEGNPFFVEEILKSLVSGGDLSDKETSWNPKFLRDLHIPHTIQDAVQQRVAQLGDATRQVMTVAAVAGRRFDFALLQVLTQHNEQDLLRSIKELIDAQLVIEDSSERFSFRHALTRQAIYSKLLIRERTVLHLSIAEALERLHGNERDTYITELAYHFYEAGCWEKARLYCAQAGERAAQLYALQSAIEQFTHALEAAHHLDAPLPSTLYRARAVAYQVRGEFEQAEADLETAQRIAKLNQDTREEWQLLLDLGQLWTERNYSKAIGYFQNALDLVQRIEDPERLARTLNLIGNWYVNSDRPMDAIGYHKQALALFEKLDSKPGIAETLNFLGFTYTFVGDTWQGKSTRDQAIDLFRELDDLPHLIDALCSSYALCSPARFMETMLPASFSLEEAIRQINTGLRMAREIDSPNAESWALLFLHSCTMSQGKYAEAIVQAAAGMAIAQETGHGELMCGFHTELGALYLDLFAMQQAQWHLDQARRQAQQIGHKYFASNAIGWLAFLNVQQGRLEEAQAMLDSVSDAVTPMVTQGQRRCWYSRAKIALAQGNASHALDLLNALINSAPNSESGQVIPLLTIARGEALLALGRYEEAVWTLQQAQDTANARGILSLEWRSAAALGKAYRLQRQRSKAEDAFEHARTVIAALSANIEGENLRETFLQGVSEYVPPVRIISQRQETKRSFGGLTTREREIAALIARGHTNRRIAETLVISDETVTVHVKHILSKLDFTSRAQIAAWITQKDSRRDTP